jgi:hypothetical protein
MATALSIGILISFILAIIIQSKWKQQKSELSQEIDYLNRNLNEDNLETFVSTKSFDFRDTFSSSTPKVIYDDRNMKNGSYRRAIEDYESAKRIASISTILFSAIGITLTILLLIYFPEFVVEVFENDGPK